MSSADELLQHAGRLMVEGRLDEAADALRGALTAEPDNPDAHHALGVLLLHRQSMEDAIAHLEEAIKLDPDFAKAHHQLGVAYFMQARPSDAISSLRRAVDLDPELSAAHLQLGGLLQANGRLVHLAGYDDSFPLEHERRTAYRTTYLKGVQISGEVY